MIVHTLDIQIKHVKKGFKIISVSLSASETVLLIFFGDLTIYKKPPMDSHTVERNTFPKE